MFSAMPADVGMAFVVIAHLAPGRESALAEILGRSTSLPVRRGRGRRHGRGRPCLCDPARRARQHGERPAAGAAGRSRQARAQSGRRLPRQPRRGRRRARDRHHPLRCRQRRHARHQGRQGAWRADPRPGHRRLRAAPPRHAHQRHRHRPRRPRAAGGADPGQARRLCRRASASLADSPSRPTAAAIRDDQRCAQDHLRDPAQPGRPRLHRLQGADLPAPGAAPDAGAAAQRHRDLHRAAAAGAGRGVAAVPRPADRRHRLLPRYRGLRGSRDQLVMPRLLEGKGAGDTIRVWCPGCATGEEVYSIAILLRERLDTAPGGPQGADVRHRHRRGRAGRGTGRPLPRGTPPRHEPRATAPLLHRGRGQLPPFQADPGHVHLLLAQRHPRSALLAHRPDLLPQPADLHRRRPAKAGDPGIPLCAEIGRVPVPRQCREREPARRPVHRRSTRSTASSSAASTASAHLRLPPSGIGGAPAERPRAQAASRRRTA